MNREAKIVVFSTPTCGWCSRVKSYLREKGFRFRDVDVSKDPKAVSDMVRISGQMGVPVILIDNKPVVGFDVGKINRLLGI
jgi:glutaredoxin-like YruB-family protein